LVEKFGSWEYRNESLNLDDFKRYTFALPKIYGRQILAYD
jgi:hypothetical protein